MALIDYLNLKNKLLGFELTTKEDLDEIGSWDKKVKDEVAEIIKENISELEYTFPFSHIDYNVDSGLCPWCITNECVSCKYGARHLVCDSPGSRYKKCLKKIHYKYIAGMVIKNMTVLKKSLSLEYYNIYNN